MKRYSKFLLTFVVSLIALLLVACGSNTNGEGNNSNKENNNSSGDETTISGDLEIQYFVGGYGDKWWKEVISDFNEKYPDVNIIEHAGPNINHEMKTRWISDNPPDVVYIDGDGASETQMIKDKQLMDISDWLDGITMENGEKLADSFIADPEVLDDGGIYSLPLAFDTWGMWYDHTWFEEDGFTVPDDYDSWIESMKEIKDKTDIYPFNTTGNYPQYFERGVLLPAFASAGGEEFLNDLLNGDVDAWKSPEALEVIKKAENLFTEDLVDHAFAARSHTQTQMNFLMHDNAFIAVGFWLPTEMANDTPDDFEYGFVPTPMNDSDKPMSLVPDLRPVAIAKDAKNPEAAKAFMEFIFTETYAQKFAEYTGAIMNLENVDLEENKNVPTFLKNVNETINNPGQVVVSKRNTPEGEKLDLAIKISDEVKKQVVPLLLGKITAEEFIDKIVAVAEKG